MPVSSPPEISSLYAKDGLVLGQPRKKGSSSIWLILVLVVLVAIAGMRFLTEKKVDVARVRVVAAAVDIPAGTRLGFSNLRYMDLPKAYWTPQMVSSTHLLFGRCARQLLSQAEPILVDQVLPGKSGFSSLLAESERAITLKLPEEAMVEHALEPDDLVDVIFTESHKGTKFTRSICQRAKVILAMSKQTLASKHGKSSEASLITLAVSKGEAERLAFAEESGKLTLVLRNRNDSEEFTPSTIKDKTIFPSDFDEENKTQLSIPPAPPAPSPLLPPPPVGRLEPEKEEVQKPVWSFEMWSGACKKVLTVPLSDDKK